MSLNNTPPQERVYVDVVPAVKQRHTTSSFIYGDRALADALDTSLSTIRTWRNKGLIPFIRTGYKSIAYELPDVLAALRALRVKPITEKGVR